MNNVALSKDDFLEAIERMTVSDLVSLTKAMEERFGVSAQAPVMMGQVMPSMQKDTADADEGPVMCLVSIVGLSDPSKKIGAIKVIRDLMGADLQLSKRIAEEGGAVNKTGVTAEEARTLAKKLEDAGLLVKITDWQ
jgi:large subunit ribosomal protein L7/L12